MDKKEQNKKRKKLFIEIWNERRKWDDEEKDWYVRSFETGKILWERIYKYNLACYSHILSKIKYPEYDLLKINIEIVHPDEHNTFEINEDKCPNQKKRKIELLKLHREGKLGKI